MSLHRENVVWQSADGTWSRAAYDFYESTAGRDHDPDWDGDPDPEWDVEYTGDFHWASCGHPSEEAALRSWSGPNPGGHSTVRHGTSPADADDLDKRAAVLELRCSGVLVKDALNHWASFEGRSKVSADTLLPIAEETNEALARSIVAQQRYRLEGYANDERPHQARYREERDVLLERLESTGSFSDDDYDRYMDRQYDRVLTGLRELESRTRDARSGSMWGPYNRPAPPPLEPLLDLIETVQLERNELQESMRERSAPRATKLSVPGSTGRPVDLSDRTRCNEWMPRARRNCSLARNHKGGCK